VPHSYPPCNREKYIPLDISSWGGGG
jgi:hypothetical protein